MTVPNTISLNDLELTRLFIALTCFLAAGHTFAYLFQTLRMPRVIGEIVGGIVLGPSVFGFLWPEGHAWIFLASPLEGKLIAAIYYLGLVLLMFIAGLELHQSSSSRRDRRLVLAMLLGGTVLPFLAGWGFPALYDCAPFVGPNGNPASLRIVLGIAVAVTSIPVISKIFIDLDIMHTRFARIIVSTATIEDLLLWVALAVVTGMVRSQEVNAWEIARTFAISLTFLGLSLRALPSLLRLINRVTGNLLVDSSATGYALAVCMLLVSVASLLEVNVVFGALVAGILIGGLPQQKFAAANLHIKQVALGFFVPIYFTTVGFKLDLLHSFAVLPFVVLLLYAMVVKTVGTLWAARLAGSDWLSSFNLSMAMNARGGPGIVLATITFDLGIISEKLFVILVCIAIVTSLFAGYWFRYLLVRGWPLLAGDREFARAPAAPRRTSRGLGV